MAGQDRAGGICKGFGLLSPPPRKAGASVSRRGWIPEIGQPLARCIRFPRKPREEPGIRIGVLGTPWQERNYPLVFVHLAEDSGKKQG
jgi:hypothetical protein